MQHLALSLVAVVMLALAAPGPVLPEPILLPTPPFAYYFIRPATEPRASPVAARLFKVSETPNRITDTDRWFQSNNLVWPALEADRLSRGDRAGLPAEIPPRFAGDRLIRAIMAPPMVLAIYGEDFSGGRYLVGYDTSRRAFSFAFDFRNYIEPPAYIEADRAFVDELVQWAQTADGVLYVSNFHRTYARSSYGLNAYITAIELASSSLRWRTRSLVSNSANFVIAGRVMITGYGFTAEPDYLYLLNRTDGHVAQAVGVRSGPEYLVLKQDRLFVRTYNTDAVFRLVR